MLKAKKTKVVVFAAVMVMSMIIAAPSMAMMGGGGGSSSGGMGGGSSSGGMMGSMSDMMGGLFGGNSEQNSQGNSRNGNNALVVTSQSQAEGMVKNQIARNPNVQTGAVIERTDDFTVDVLTKDGAVIDQMVVDKRSGNIRSIYR
tara:strand:- start:171 stop:605 length:435 start_codon:yes stop_codon:yes gene_type:complete